MAPVFKKSRRDISDMESSIGASWMLRGRSIMPKAVGAFLKNRDIHLEAPNSTKRLSISRKPPVHHVACLSMKSFGWDHMTAGDFMRCR